MQWVLLCYLDVLLLTVAVGRGHVDQGHQARHVLAQRRDAPHLHCIIYSVLYCIVLYCYGGDIVMLYCLTEPTFMRMARERSSSNLTVAAQWRTISASRRSVSRSAEYYLSPH